MIEYGENIDGTELRTQVCIVGSGPAAITLAWYLLDQEIDVILLEGSRNFNNQGGPNYNNNTLLYNGESSGLLYSNNIERDFLIRPENPNRDPYPNIKERERTYGGTGTHWGGQCRPLNAITFEARPHFPGWPVTREELDDSYAEACSFMQLYGDYYGPDGKAGYNFTAEFWAENLGEEVTNLDGFEEQMYQWPVSSMLRFQTRVYNGTTIGDSKARVILNASLLAINHQQGSTTSLTVGSMTGDANNPTQATEFTVVADAYVLACGAVANARQLLLSDVGNEYDQVGRHFMCHPFSNGLDPVRVNGYDYLNQSQIRLLSYQSVSQGEYGISTIAGKLTPSPDSLRALEIGQCWFDANGGNFYHEVISYRESRITLCEGQDQVDPVFHQPQTHINWVLDPLSQQSYERTTTLFKDSIQAYKGSPVSVTIQPWASVESQLVINGHHLGTTRMSAQPEDGVVDKNLKVHSMDNLYVAGSSVWASAGISNPTFSIITFSIRLAKHLAGVLGVKPG